MQGSGAPVSISWRAEDGGGKGEVGGDEEKGSGPSDIVRGRGTEAGGGNQGSQEEGGREPSSSGGTCPSGSTKG